MRYAPIHIVDTAEVPPERADAMALLLKETMVPVMRRAGVELGSMLMSSPEFGQPVLFQTTWRVPDHDAWNLIRKDLLFDPDWSRMWAQAKALRTAGSRRFLYPVDQAEAAR